MSDARTTLAEAIGHESDRDLTPELLAEADRVLIALYFAGFVIMPAPEEQQT